MTRARVNSKVILELYRDRGWVGHATYCEASFVRARRILTTLAELRRFYRQGLAAKLAMIARAA